MLHDRREEREARPAGGAGSLSARAHQAVTAMIRSRRLVGGEAIVEQRLAATLGISRTPLREALQRLEGEGLLVKRSNRSFMVRHVDLGEYLQSLKVREILEPEAAAAAIGRVAPERLTAVRRGIRALEPLPNVHTEAHWESDDALHELFLDACGNPVLARIVRELRVTTRLFEIARLSDRVVPDRIEHTAVLDAAEAGDAKAARRAMAHHIRSLARHALGSVGG